MINLGIYVMSTVREMSLMSFYARVLRFNLLPLRSSLFLKEGQSFCYFSACSRGEPIATRITTTNPEKEIQLLD